MQEILTTDDKKKLYDHLIKTFNYLTFLNKIENNMLLIGVGGTITTMAAIKQKLLQ